MNGLEALNEIKGYREVATLAGYVKQPIKKACKKEFAIIKKELKKLGKLEDIEDELGIDNVVDYPIRLLAHYLVYVLIKRGKDYERIRGIE